MTTGPENTSTFIGMNESNAAPQLISYGVQYVGFSCCEWAPLTRQRKVENKYSLCANIESAAPEQCTSANENLIKKKKNTKEKILKWRRIRLWSSFQWFLRGISRHKHITYLNHRQPSIIIYVFPFSVETIFGFSPRCSCSLLFSVCSWLHLCV